MKTLIVFILITLAFLSLSDAHVEVISTTCIREDYKTGQESWMTCPRDAVSFGIRSIKEYHDAKEDNVEERKYCCGDKLHRFCCTLDTKMGESPTFNLNEEDYSDPYVKYYYHKDWYQLGWFSYLIIFVVTLAVLALVAYLFGCVFAQVLELLFCIFCSLCGKKKPSKEKKSTGKRYRPEAFSETERSTLVIVPSPSTPATFPTSLPTNYRTILPSTEFGGVPDLYQNVSAPRKYPDTRNAAYPPTYEEAQRQEPQRPTTIYPNVQS